MFRRKREPDPFEEMVKDAIRVTLSNPAISAEDLAKQLDSLTKLLEVAKSGKDRKFVSADVKATIAANLLGILMIIRHEFANPLNSKALSFVIRPRI